MALRLDGSPAQGFAERFPAVDGWPEVNPELGSFLGTPEQVIIWSDNYYSSGVPG